LKAEKETVKMKRGYIRRKYIYVSLNVVVAALFFALVLASPASAFLWVTNSVSTSLGDSTLAGATVSLELIEQSEKQIMDFQNSPAAIKTQVDMLGYVSSLKEQAAIDEYFTAWCLSDLLPDGKSNFKAAESVARFSILQRSYTFKNASSIPVYFRINRAILTNDDIGLTLAAFWSMDGGETLDSFDYEPFSDCYYLKAPLLIDEEITVLFAAMVLDTGEASGSFDFRANFAEIIQSTNNAVYLADGWQYFAKEFLPYSPLENISAGIVPTGEGFSDENYPDPQDGFSDENYPDPEDISTGDGFSDESYPDPVDVSTGDGFSDESYPDAGGVSTGEGFSDENYPDPGGGSSDDGFSDENFPDPVDD